MSICINNSKIKLMCGGAKVRKIMCQNKAVYSSGSPVTYHITDSLSFTEEISEGESVLSPTSFSPTGLVGASWDFIGWREDKAASATVLTSKTMGESAINLYAVYRLTITVSYNGNGATSGSTSAQTTYRYFNNGNYSTASVTLKSNGFTKTNYKFTKWALNSSSGTQYAAGASLTVTGNVTMYAVWTVFMTIQFTYTGKYEKVVENASSGAFKIRFLTSGTLVFQKLEILNGIDLFLVGGGGGGSASGQDGGGSGGGGGYTKTVKKIALKTNTSYPIVIGSGGSGSGNNTNAGSNGGASSAFGYLVNGGQGGGNGSYGGGKGGSGGGGGSNNTHGTPTVGASGGSNGGNGGAGGKGYGANDSAAVGGSGQGTTTREFGESSGTLYGPGGGGGISISYQNNKSRTFSLTPSASTGGGRGGYVSNEDGKIKANGTSGIDNTGGGGGAGAKYGSSYATPGNGGSGIVIIRDAR